MNPLLSAATTASDSIIDDINALVDHETYSRDLDCLSDGLTAIRTLARRHLGEPDHAERHDGGDHGDTLVLRYDGTGGGHVLVIGHYDTVWPTGTLTSWPPREATDQAGRATLTGPGIFDMKTGLVQGIRALRLLRDTAPDAKLPTVTFLFNGDEEIGSPSSRPVIESAASTADAVLVLEPTSGGAVKTGRKGVGLFTVRATGVEAHAGLNPTAGASAIHALAAFVTDIVRVADLERGTSVNVGLIEGGSGSNVAAGFASAVVDIRVESAEEMARVDRDVDALRSSDDRVSIAVDHDWNRPPMTLTAASARLLTVVQSAAAELGHDLRQTSVGGGSDANFVSALGIPVLCGMGAVGDGAHARTEFIYPDQVPLFTALTANTLSKLAEGLSSE